MTYQFAFNSLTISLANWLSLEEVTMKRLRLLLLFVVLLALAPTTALAATVGATTLADPSTATTWRNWGLENSTQNVGRIWTDKTVSAEDIVLTGAGGDKIIPKEKGSDFLTAFSAISSTSNLRETATTPLDIVLVLDASGSMDDPMGNNDSTKRIDALKAAANSFIDEIAARNAGISKADQRHSVAVVKFSGDKTGLVGNDTYRDGRYTYNYSQAMQNLTVVDANGASNLRAKVNAISPAGATRSDYGLELAQSQLEHGRAGARKVVVFFTDGKPTSYSEFDDGVASSAIATAKAIKDAGGTVYTIGIFSGADATADPTATSSENKFMQAVSSNYPNATYAYSWGGYSWNLGTRVNGAAFYKTATNADELKKVFDGISKEISDAAGYPTDVTDGLEHASGYVTFTDQLGDYMQVDDFNCILFANQVFKAKTKTTSGNTDTYVFSGTAGNVLYPAGDLSSIVIEVRRSGEGDVRTGDHVTIKVPAALIPLRAFEVNADNNTGSVSLTFPIRVFFGSSLKPQAAALLANPDAQMADYMKTHRDKSGNVFFLANTWSGKANGDAAATFTPAEENSYYYITRDTPIYEDKALTQPAAYPLVKGKTYYYERTFWNISGTSASQDSRIVSFDSSAVKNIDGYISDTGDGHAQFSQGTPRMTYINELHNDKSSNATKTAKSFINPKWSGNQVFVWLGNNGKLSLPEPGSLEVSKTIVVPEGFDAAVYAGQDFDFTVSIPEAKGKTVTGTVTDAAGQVQGDANFSIAFDDNGTYTHKLKGGQKLTITGLSSGWKYEVTEASLSGWTASPEGASGTIAAGEKSVAAFSNTYGATGTLSGDTSLNGEKTLTGRAWTAQDKFCFVLTGIDGAPMPKNSVDGKFVLELTRPEGTPGSAAVGFDFDDITYTKPGTYVYNIVEARAGDGYDVTILPGVSVSQALYRVTVTVTDKNHDGTLVVTSTMLRLKDDSGATLADGTGEEANCASFTNVFDVKEAEWDLRGTKNYEDKTGSHPLSSGMFKFELTAKTDGAPMPANAQGGKAVASVDATGRFAFGQVKFDENDVNPHGAPKTYEYELCESNFREAGMTYDATVWHISVTVSLDEAGTVVLNVTNRRALADGALGEAELITFDNSYEAESAVVKGFIHGTKTLKGRDSLDGEKFTFSLMQASGPEGGCTGFSPEVEVGDLADSEAKSFDFGTATFTKAGTYVFEVREVGAGQTLRGMTYDGHTYTVTVKVADEDGKLVVQSTTYSDEAARDVEAATFINTYRPADADYAGITVSKTLIGRTMREGEFNFTITGEDEQSQALLAQKAAPSDCAFANDGQRASGEKDAMTKLSGLHFDRSDVGTYRFKVAEVIPADPAGKLPGVTYDKTVYHVKISVADALNGTLAVTTTIVSDDGDPVTEVAFQNTYQAAPDSFATANFGLAKVLKGRDWASTDAFTFKLVGLSGAPMPANSQVIVKAADASNGRAPFDFGQISYAAAGTYEYEVHEVNAGQTVNGVDYTTNVAHFLVTVTDSTATGQLMASSRLVSGSAAFENRYSAELDYNAKGGLTITKTLEGTSAPADKFGFTISTKGYDVLGIAGTYSSPEIADGGTVTIAATSGEIVFTQNDAGKTWKYTVTEDPLGAGYSCDCSKWDVSVSVANDVENGGLLVTTTVSGEGGTRSWTYASDGEAAVPGATVAFVNRYAATGSTADIVGTKTLNGRLMSAREFEFQLVDEAGDVVATARNDESGSVNFGRLSYTAPGTYTYTAREVTDGLKAEGVTPVRGSFTITVKVTDNGDGTLDCDVIYPKVGLAFENSYGTGDAEIEVSGTKVLEGRNLRDGEFDFTITGEAGAPMPERTKVTNANGGFSFGKIAFTLDKVFGGVVIQDADGEAGQSGEVPSDEEPVADSESEAGPRVEAPSSETGEKDAELELAAPETEPVSDPSDSPAPAEEPQQDELLAQDEVADLGTPVVEEVSAPDAEAASTPDATDVATVNAAHWQTVRRNLFHIASEVVEPLAGTSRQRTFHYVVTETGSATGVTNDLRNTRDIYITVTDDGHGKLTAEFTKADGSPLDPAGQPDLTFTNVYKPKPTPSSVTDQVTITKALTGRSMVAGEFRFEMLEDGKKVATGANAADGTVTLSPITYDAPGTHSYEIREVNGGKTIDGVRYSGTTYHVNTTVSDTGNGKLAVKHELVEEGPATFTNAYETTPADVTITAHKELLGATLTDGQFAFQLTGMGSALRATNDAQGNVAFPHLLLTEPGTYTYELRELNDGQEGVTYDERVYVVTVTVTDDGLGHLSAEVSMDAADGALAFTNTYTPPVTPEEPPAPKPPTKPDPAPAPKPARPSRPLPKAGDVTSDAIVVTLVAVAVALLAGTLAMRRRR